MTPEAMPHGAGEHPEVDELSDLSEGILPLARAQQVRAHLEDCALCADTHASLTEIRSALGTLPGPVRMPADVAGRIDAALAAEALLDAHREAPVSRETGPADRAEVSRETKRASTRSASPPAGPAPGSTRPGSAGPGSTGPGSTGPGRGSSRRARRLRALLTTTGVLAVLGLGGVVFQGLDGGASDAGRPTAQQERTEGDGGAMADDGLERRVQALLDQRAGQKGPGQQDTPPDLLVESGEPGADPPPAGGPAVVPSCVREGIGRPEQPLAAEPGRPYAGHPSYLVVLPHPGDPQRVDAYVVDSSCTADSTSGPGEVLAERTYRRD